MPSSHWFSFWGHKSVLIQAPFQTNFSSNIILCASQFKYIQAIFVWENMSYLGSWAIFIKALINECPSCPIADSS